MAERKGAPREIWTGRDREANMNIARNIRRRPLPLSLCLAPPSSSTLCASKSRCCIRSFCPHYATTPRTEDGYTGEKTRRAERRGGKTATVLNILFRAEKLLHRRTQGIMERPPQAGPQAGHQAGKGRAESAKWSKAELQGSVCGRGGRPGQPTSHLPTPPTAAQSPFRLAFCRFSAPKIEWR